ncbi:MAG TPA: hypothetical protein VFU31_00500 [Candidatus Binatia bacterium]|nr:hypothetical protein [Candidatus Binatia bacterium]
MSDCENIDGQCAASWCDCDYQRRKRKSSFAAFEIKTEQGNSAMIKGDPNMPEATRKALAEMIDAAVEAANAGELKAPENAVCCCGYDLRVSGHCGCNKYFSICLGCHRPTRLNRCTCKVKTRNADYPEEWM